MSVGQPAMNLLERGFVGSILSLFAQACNLVNGQGEVIALVGRPIGNGPLNIVLENGTGFLARDLATGLPVEGDGHRLRLGNALTVSLNGAAIWEPRLEGTGLLDDPRWKVNLAVLYHHLVSRAPAESLAHLLAPGSAERGGMKSAYREAARQAIGRLLAALQVGDRQGIAAGAAALAGLGPGLTPAGDDFLLGLMAGLRTGPPFLEGKELSVAETCQIIYEAAAERTNLLSRALLRSAKEGLFSEAWPILVATLRQGKADKVREAADRILGFGGTSGADALAGFLSLWS